MLVIFGPKDEADRYIDEKVKPAVEGWAQEPPQLYTKGKVAVAFWPSKAGVEIVTKPNGWFLGHAYWDDLPQGYSEDSKDILEVCLKLWKLEGVDFVKRLNGSFNLFLHDADSGKSIVSTDRFATYPLWQTKTDKGWWAFSPCYDVLQGLVENSVDLAGLWSFMVRARPIGDRTLLEHIRGVRAGHAICFGDSPEPNVVEWHAPKFKPESDRSASSWGTEFREHLGEVIPKQLHGFDSPGLLLSGGLDSRLIASFCPPQTRCFTLADFRNREMKTAAKVAAICGLQHVPIIRQSDWYPNMVESAAKGSFGLWRWPNAHYMPLENYKGSWQEVDCVVTGCWFDTFLKCFLTRASGLWSDVSKLGGPDKVVSHLLDMDTSQWTVAPKLKELMHAKAFQDCGDAYREVLKAEIRKAIPMSSNVVDIWEMSQFRCAYRAPFTPNITFLRKFIPTRNVIFDNRFFDLYFRLPASVKRTGTIVRRALWQRKKALGILCDSNSWLPALLPSVIHKKAVRARNKIWHLRSWWYRLTGSREYRSFSSWPHIGRLWVHNPKMSGLMENLLKNPPDLLEQFFSMDSLSEAWEKHKKGTRDYPDVLNIIAGLGLFEMK